MRSSHSNEALEKSISHLFLSSNSSRFYLKFEDMSGSRQEPEKMLSASKGSGRISIQTASGS